MVSQPVSGQEAPASAPPEGDPGTIDSGWDEPEPASAEPAPVEASETPEPAQPQPHSGPPPANPPPPQAAAAGTPPPTESSIAARPTGIGMLVAGPVVTAIGIPLSLLGNMAWRNACGPDTSDDTCFNGTVYTGLAHTGTALAYAGGMVLTGLGGGRLGVYRAEGKILRGAPLRRASGLKVAGAVLLPSAVISMGLARLLFWLPTPDCQEASCVRNYQLASTMTVGGLALLGTAGAGMLMYGLRHDRRLEAHHRISIAPQFGPTFAGLGASGRF